MTLTLLTAYNAPYLAALTFVLLTGIAELIALLCGHSLSSAMDTPDLPEGLTGEALDWLNIGRIPLLIVLCMLAGFFGIWFVAAGRTAAAGNSHQDVIQSVYRSPTTVS